MTEQEIRDELSRVVTQWNRISGKRFTYYGVTKQGTGYQRSLEVPDVPRFDMFYVYRSNVMKMLSDLKVDVVDLATVGADSPEGSGAWGFGGGCL